MNSNANRPVDFSHEVVAAENVQIDVIRIPLQARPIFLKKSFGKLHPGAVYIRRGSATVVADPDEVVKMAISERKQDSVDSPRPTREERIIETLRRDLAEGTTLLVEKQNQDYGGSSRQQCIVAEVNNHYANFCYVRDNQTQISGAIEKITISYEPAMKMKLIQIAR